MNSFAEQDWTSGAPGSSGRIPLAQDADNIVRGLKNLLEQQNARGEKANGQRRSIKIVACDGRDKLELKIRDDSIIEVFGPRKFVVEPAELTRTNRKGRSSTVSARYVVTLGSHMIHQVQRNVAKPQFSSSVAA
jgi:hypothetical protein